MNILGDHPPSVPSFSPTQENILNINDSDSYRDDLDSFLIYYLKQIMYRFGLYYFN